MKSSRAYAVELIQAQLVRNMSVFGSPGNTHSGLNKGGKHHYGKQELRELLDFIYGEPRDDSERVK